MNSLKQRRSIKPWKGLGIRAQNRWLTDLETADSVEAFSSEGSRALGNGSQKKKNYKSPGVLQTSAREVGGTVDSRQEFIIKGHPSMGVWCSNLKLLEGNSREVAMVLRRVEGMELTELQDRFHVVDEWLQGCLKTPGSVSSHVISHTDLNGVRTQSSCCLPNSVLSYSLIIL